MGSIVTTLIAEMTCLRLLPSLVTKVSWSQARLPNPSPNTFVGTVRSTVYRCASNKTSKWKIWKSKEEPLLEDEEPSEMELYQQEVEELEREAKAEFIQSRRNKSRLSASDRQMLHGNPPHHGVMFEYNSLHRSKEFKRSMLSKYGKEKTGVEPGIVWPTEKEVQLAIEWEELYQEKPLIDQIKDTKRNIVKRKEDRIARELLVEEILKKMDTQVKQWKVRVGARNKLAETERERREKVLAELKLEFGYNINPEDNYMKERIAEREKVIIKEEREAKKAAKKEKAAASK